MKIHVFKVKRKLIAFISIPLKAQSLINEIKTLHAKVVIKDRELSQCLRLFVEMEKQNNALLEEVEDAKE